MPGSHCTIFAAVLTMHDCLGYHLVAVVCTLYNRSQTSLHCLQTTFHTQTHTRIDTGNDVRSLGRRAFSHENGFIPVQACSPSCLYDDLQWKINKQRKICRTEWLVAYVLLQIYYDSTPWTFPCPESCSLIGCKLSLISFPVKTHFILQDCESKIIQCEPGIMLCIKAIIDHHHENRKQGICLVFKI